MTVNSSQIRYHQGNILYYNSSGELHRVGGPAVIKASGREEWRFKNKRHRVDGPATVWINGNEEYWVNGERHRTDGPAVIRSNGSEQYWVNGKFVKESWKW